MNGGDVRRFEDTLVSVDGTIMDALRSIDNAWLQIALVVDDDRTLVGTVTDGDIRRAILAGIKLDEPVTKVMNNNPLSVSEGMAADALLDLMTERKIYRIPVVDSDGRVIGLKQIDELIEEEEERFAHMEVEHVDPKDVWVVLMLGGQGERLRPLTEDIPKPMIDVGGKPLLETIVGNLVKQGFKKFFFSINYKADVIRDHFGDGSEFGVEITYIEEKDKMGTAGALSLLPEKPEKPVVVMNGDILTNSNFVQLIDFHCQNHAHATMCVREYQYQVPYGIVQTVGTKLDAIVEKPSHSYFVNAGIYILSPSVLEHVPQGEHFDMPKLFEVLSEEKKSSIVFPIREYWLDIGSFEDLEKAKADYSKFFKG